MTNQHCHTECEHKNLAYCPHCKVAYCKDCNKEWHENSYTTTWSGTYIPCTYTTGTGSAITNTHLNHQ